MTTDPHQEARQDQDLEFQTVYAPANYHGPKTGAGRWVPLYAHAGEVPLGTLWASDDGKGLGFIPTTPEGQQRVPEFYTAFQRAAAAKADPREVFDYWAGKASLNLSAGPMVAGDLDTLTQ